MLFFTWVILTACSPEKETSGIEDLPIHIDLTKYETKDLFLSDFVEDISYVKLETNHEYLINSSAMVLKCPNGFLIKTSKMELGVFSEKGKYLNKIGKLGNGPGEYRHINNPAIAFNSGKIFAQRDGSHTYYRFDLQGKLEKSVTYKKFIQAQEIVCVYDKLLVDGSVYLKEDSFVPYFILDQDLNLVYEHEIPIPESIDKASDAPGLYHSNYLDRVYLFNMHRDTVFYIDSDFKPKPYVILHRGEVQLKYEDRFVPHGGKFSADRFLRYFCDRGNIILMVFNEKPESISAFYDRSSNSLYRFINNGLDNEEFSFGIENDIDGGPMLPFHHSTHDGYGYAAIQAIDLIHWNENGCFDLIEARDPYKRKELMDMISSLNEEDNPVIMKVKFKSRSFTTK